MTHDCLIVGAGVVGLSLAYELAKKSLRVLVIDRKSLAREASWAGAGILPPANPRTAIHPYDQLRALSFALHREWAEQLRTETGIDTGYRRCGGIYLARTVGEGAALHGFAGLCREEDIEIESLSAKSLSEIEPALFGQDSLTSDNAKPLQLRAAYHLPEEAQLRNPWHLRALIDSLRKLGVEFLENAELLSCQIQNERVQSVSTSAGDISVNRICITSGAWTSQLLSMLGIANGVIPIRGQMILFALPKPILKRVVNEGSRYLVPREDGHLLAGSTEEEAGFEATNTPQGIADLTKFAYGLVPALRTATIEKTWAGIRPGSFDGLPYLGALPGLENAFVAAGHFRSGLYLSPGTAVVMRQLIMGERPEIDLEPFRPSRG